MSVKKDEQSISLQVDTLPVTTGRITRRVDVSAPLYVGGVPQAFRASAGIVCNSFVFQKVLNFEEVVYMGLLDVLVVLS